jgi:dipeptidyl aminopeptidase/acylaminoacyl peptidase
MLHGIDFQSRNPAEWADNVACPVFLIHGKSDKRIPPGHSETILQRLRTDKELWLVEEAGHTEAFERSPATYVGRIAGFLNRIRPQGLQPQ